MESFMDGLTHVNDTINTFVWVQIGLVLLIGAGVLLTILLGFFQVTHIKHWMKKTIGGVFDKSSHNKNEKGSVSSFRLCALPLRQPSEPEILPECPPLYV